MKLEIFSNIEQGTDEWHALRSSQPTCSELATIMTDPGGGGFGEGAITYMRKMIAQRISGNATAWEGNANTRRGHALEPVARDLYADSMGMQVDACGFMRAWGLGYSPDGLVGDDGLVEIKTKQGHLQIEVLERDELPDEHFWQCHGGLTVSGRQWLDFISYCPGLPLFVHRVHRDEAVCKAIRKRVDKFNLELEVRLLKIINPSMRNAK